jgi:hypothetical protein
MTNQAKMYLEPTVLPTARRDLNNLRRTSARFAKDQVRGLRQGARSAQGLARGYDSVDRSVRRVNAGMRSVVGQAASLKTVIAGAALGGAGKSLIDMTIGESGKVARSQAVLKLLIKDADKFNKTNAVAKELVQDVSSLDFASSLSGLEKTYTLAAGNLPFAKELVKVAKGLEQLDPSQGFEGALFALKELESGDTMSLRGRFGIRLAGQKEAKKAAKKAKKSIKQYYFDEVIKFVDKRYGDKTKRMSGVENLLRIDRESTSGRIGMIKTAWKDIFRTIGDEANAELGSGVVDLQKEMNKLHADPQFKKDVKVIAKDFASMTKSVVETTAKLPGMYKKARKFATDNSTALKVGGGLLVANKLTGGRLASGGANLLRRGLFGRRGGGALGKAMGSVGGGMPVYVTNAHEIGSGVGATVGKGAAGAAAGGASKGLLGSLASKGVVGTFGAAGAGAGLGMLGTLAFAAYTFADATERTQKVTESFDKKAAQLEAAQSARRRKRMKRQAQEIADAFMTPLAARMKKREAAMLRTLATNVVLSNGGQDAHGTIRMLLGTKKGKERAAQLKRINQALANTGVNVGVRKGQLNFSGTDAMGMDRASRLQNLKGKVAYDDAAKQYAMMHMGGGFASMFGQGVKGAIDKSATLQVMVQQTFHGGVDSATAKKGGDGVVNALKKGLKREKLTK